MFTKKLSRKNKDTRPKKEKEPMVAFKFNSVGVKLFSIFFISIVFCVVAVGLFSYTNSKKIIETKVAESSQQTIVQTAEKLNIVFEDYVSKTVGLIINKDLTNFLVNSLNENSSEFEKYTAIKSATELIKMDVYTNKSITSVSIIPIDKEHSVITSGVVPEDIRSEKWFEEAVSLDGDLKWIETSVEGILGYGNEPTFGVSRLVNGANGTFKYVLLLEFSLANLEQYLTSAQLGEEGYTMVLNGENRVIYSSDSEMLTSEHIIDETKMIKVSHNIGEVGWKVVGAFPKTELSQETESIRWLTIIMTIAAALIAVGIGFVVMKMIGHPLTKLSMLMEEGKKGNLTVRSHIKSNDEIGQLAQSFNDMMNQFTHLVHQVNSSSVKVLRTASDLTTASFRTADAAKEIAAATEEIAMGASTLATEAENGANLTVTITEQMKKVVQTNESMGNSAYEVNKVSEKGTFYMSELIAKTNSTEEMNRSMIKKVDELKENTGSIRKILDLLNNITQQTNILSFNAAIEAARAGEAGKGFMVVADEIRKLADQSSQSIKVVGEITDTIQREINETVDVLSTAYPLFQEQVTSVKESDIIFKSVKDEMFSFLDQLGSVSQSIYQLENSQTILSNAMENVSAVAEESSATSEEVASLSNQQLSIGENLIELSTQLEKVSQELTDSLKSFQL